MGRQKRRKSKLMGLKLRLIRQHFGLSQVAMLAVVRPGFDPDNRALISQSEKGSSDPTYQVLLAYTRYANIKAEVLIDDRQTLTAALLDRAAHRSPPGRDGNALLIVTAGTDETRETREIKTDDVETNDVETDDIKMNDVETDDAETQNCAMDDCAADDSEADSAETNSSETGDAETNGVVPPKESRAVRLRRRSRRELSDSRQLFDCRDDLAEDLTLRLPGDVLDDCDALYLELLNAAPRRARPILHRNYFYRLLILIGHDRLTDAEESGYWRRLWNIFVNAAEQELNDAAD